MKTENQLKQRKGKVVMAQTAKTQQRRLMPTPKALQKALEKSAQQAQRLADAFGVKVPMASGKARTPVNKAS